MNDAEQYAIDRQDAMTKVIMGTLRPSTLARMLRDLEWIVDRADCPPPEDVVRFIDSVKRQVLS